MNLNPKRRKGISIITSKTLKEQYPHDLSLYLDPPEQEISLFEFEKCALDRLKVLRIIEFANNEGHDLYSMQWKNVILDKLNKVHLDDYVHLINSVGGLNPSELDLQARRSDYISHFLLRLSYCRFDQLRRWFLSREVELFNFRSQEMTTESVLKFFQVNNLNYNPISKFEKINLQEDLMESTSGNFDFDTTAFYKVPFKHVLSLVTTRAVFLKKGYAYVPMFQMGAFLTSNFRTHLRQALDLSNKRMHLFLNDDLIMELLNNLSSMHTENVYKTNSNNCGNVHANNLDYISKEHYPMCMRSLHEHFTTSHQLKHFSRVQYLLYLKGIGISYEECMRFWKKEFCKRIDSNTFEKKYAYSVKHAFGKVGFKNNHSSYSCTKLINFTVPSGQTHGCPYKHWDRNVLKLKLEEIGINSFDVSEIMKMTANGQYQMACGKFFECTHGRSSIVVNHPNQYFQDSWDLYNEKTEPGTSSGN